MSGTRIYETLTASDIHALMEVGAYVALAGDASHEHGAKDFKPFHLELNLYIGHDQIKTLQSRHNVTYIKLKPALMHGDGKIDIEVYSYHHDIYDLLDGSSEFQLRSGRAHFNHGSKIGMIPLHWKK